MRFECREDDDGLASNLMHHFDPPRSLTLPFWITDLLLQSPLSAFNTTSTAFLGALLLHSSIFATICLELTGDPIQA